MNWPSFFLGVIATFTASGLFAAWLIWQGNREIRAEQDAEMAEAGNTARRNHG